MPLINEALRNDSFQIETVGSLLDRIEARLGKLDTLSAADFLEIFVILDDVQTRVAEAQTADRQMPAEIAQFDFITATLRKNAGRIVRVCGGPAAYVRMREARLASPERSWWYLDAYLENTRKQALRKGGLTAAVILAVLVIFGFVYQKFLAPDPATQAKFDHLSNAQDLLGKHDYANAMAQTNLGLQAVPQDTELLVLKGYLLNQQGLSQEAAAVYAQVEKIDAPVQVWLYKTRYALMDAKYPLAIEYAQQARNIDPNSAEAIFMQGQANERAGKTAAALDLYNEAAALANKNNQVALEATIRINMGLMMQYQAGGSGGEGGTPTP